MDNDLREKFNSHSEKYLEEHIEGVKRKVRRRTDILPPHLNLKIAEIAVLFHDLGKTNPNFQRKLKGEKVREYSSHAYLSAYAFWNFCFKNQAKLKEWKVGGEQAYALLAIIARHHGNLPDFERGILNGDETKRLSKFLAENPELPMSDFLQILDKHEKFELDISADFQKKLFDSKLIESATKQPLKFFLETQFCFACLIEADKRDAGDNEIYNRQKLREKYVIENFSNRIKQKLDTFTRETELNNLRTAMRVESVETLRGVLHQEKERRVFMLTAPTGAGKTLMLLALADEILAKDKDLNVIYALPFLSITEQVETICLEIFEDNVLRIDSRAENEKIQKLQEILDDEHTDENVKRLLREAFIETTFDHPFIITTFVQIFETLLSNRNARLLRLPNFSKTIFLIDEIQALPYRLYTFFVALLDEFCRQFDSYAIISTATMPHLDISKQISSTHEAGRKLFGNYTEPIELLNAPKYFANDVFNRYRVTQIKRNSFKVADLAEFISQKNESCLVILNTIDDTKDLYNLLSKNYDQNECVLLNTHFTLADRKTKIEFCKQHLNDKEKIILISTQLIEAGVDIDFPNVYRDFCPLPSLIQSAGRCNRNGNSDFGQVYFFALQKENGKMCSELIYREEAKNFLDFCRKKLPETITETELFDIQKEFFQTKIGAELKFGIHRQANCKDRELGEGFLNIVEAINKAAFETLGKFRLIDEQYFGCEFRYYIPTNDFDDNFEKLQELAEQKFNTNYEVARMQRIAIENQLKLMSSRVVTFRVKEESFAPAPDGEECCKIRKLGDLSKYTFERGIELTPNVGCII